MPGGRGVRGAFDVRSKVIGKSVIVAKPGTQSKESRAGLLADYGHLFQVAADGGERIIGKFDGSDGDWR
jgi:hypothetical protein